MTCSAVCQYRRISQIGRERAAARTHFTDTKRETLITLYATGASYREIGVAMHLSEDQAYRLARRLGLPLRGAPKQLQRTSVAIPADVTGAQPELCADDVSSPYRAPAPPLGARLFPEVAPFPPFRTCQWIEGDNPKTWTMCGEPTWAHRPYCHAHYRRAYTRRAEIIQEAA